MPYQASRPHPSSRNPVVYERIRCLNRFVAFSNATVFVITVLITIYGTVGAFDTPTHRATRKW